MCWYNLPNVIESKSVQIFNSQNIKKRSFTNIMRLTYVLVLLLATIQTAQAQSSIRVEYRFEKTVRTQSDHRNYLTQVSLLNNSSAHYTYREQVFGAISSTVRFIEFSTPHPGRKVTAKQRAGLMQALLKAKVFELASDSQPSKSNYFSSLNIEINGRRCQVFFNTPPRSPARKALHEIMLRFAKQQRIDKRPANATTISEGDHQPARKVSLAEVLAHPNTYQGKRISVVGFYHGEEESSSLSMDEAIPRALVLKTKEWRASRGGQSGYAAVAPLYKSFLKSSVWRSGTSTFASKADTGHKNDSWVRVQGVFLRGPTGHMGLWPGEIVRITRIEPVLHPK
jgi:hypothetical protein